jgi:dUTP pyrophosphatase
MKVEFIKYTDLPMDELIQASPYDNDAGLDIKLKETIVIGPNNTYTIGCGFGLRLPAGVMAQMITRSSISKQNITIGNAPIDASYTGEIHLMISNNSNKPVMFEKGNRVAQLVMIPIINYEIVEKLNTRGDNGLGSSGK